MLSFLSSINQSYYYLLLPKLSTIMIIVVSQKSSPPAVGDQVPISAGIQGKQSINQKQQTKRSKHRAWWCFKQASKRGEECFVFLILLVPILRGHGELQRSPMGLNSPNSVAFRILTEFAFFYSAYCFSTRFSLLFSFSFHVVSFSLFYRLVIYQSLQRNVTDSDKHTGKIWSRSGSDSMGRRRSGMSPTRALLACVHSVPTFLPTCMCRSMR